MTRMEWTALAEQWQQLADDTILNVMISSSADKQKGRRSLGDLDGVGDQDPKPGGVIGS